VIGGGLRSKPARTHAFTIGKVLAQIRANGQEENTLIFFFSDNGGPTPQSTSGDAPLRGFKAQTWEGGIRIAFLMQWKGKIPAGKVDDRPVIQFDIHPTALAAAGVKAPGEAKFDGVNLLPYPTGKKSGPPHDALYWRFGQQIAIRSGDWKLVKGAGMASVKPPAAGGKATTDAGLYNVTADIGEKTNLAQKNPEKLKELAALWDTWNAGNIDAAWGPGARRNAPNAQPGDPAQPRRKRNQSAN